MNGASARAPRIDGDDDDGGRRKVPRWLPISLLAVASAALAVPAVLLWRQRRGALGSQAPIALGRRQGLSAPPARRRPVVVSNLEGLKIPASSSSASTSSAPPPPRRASPRSGVISVNHASSPKHVTLVNAQSPSVQAPPSLFDGPLMSLGALGLATALVGVGAVVGAWGVQRSLGVENVNEFATRVRQLLLSHMPALSRRIYRSPLDNSDPLPSSSPSGAGRRSLPDESLDDWTWEAAEDRLRDAFERGGFQEWVECAVRELEAEKRVERRRRGL